MEHLGYSIRRLLSINKEGKHPQKDFDDRGNTLNISIDGASMVNMLAEDAIDALQICKQASEVEDTLNIFTDASKGPVIRMSDLNTSRTDSVKSAKCTPIKNEKSKTPKSKKTKTTKESFESTNPTNENEKQCKKAEVEEMTTEATQQMELNEIDLRRFVEDLSEISRSLGSDGEKNAKIHVPLTQNVNFEDYFNVETESFRYLFGGNQNRSTNETEHPAFNNDDEKGQSHSKYHQENEDKTNYSKTEDPITNIECGVKHSKTEANIHCKNDLINQEMTVLTYPRNLDGNQKMDFTEDFNKEEQEIQSSRPQLNFSKAYEDLKDLSFEHQNQSKNTPEFSSIDTLKQEEQIEITRKYSSINPQFLNERTIIDADQFTLISDQIEESFNNKDHDSLLLLNYEKHNVFRQRSENFPLSNKEFQIVQKRSKKEIIIFNSHPDDTCEAVRVVKVKVTLPKNRTKENVKEDSDMLEILKVEENREKSLNIINDEKELEQNLNDDSSILNAALNVEDQSNILSDKFKVQHHMENNNYGIKVEENIEEATEIKQTSKTVKTLDIFNDNSNVEQNNAEESKDHGVGDIIINASKNKHQVEDNRGSLQMCNHASKDEEDFEYLSRQFKMFDDALKLEHHVKDDRCGFNSVNHALNVEDKIEDLSPTLKMCNNNLKIDHRVKDASDGINIVNHALKGEETFESGCRDKLNNFTGVSKDDDREKTFNIASKIENHVNSSNSYTDASQVKYHAKDNSDGLILKEEEYRNASKVKHREEYQEYLSKLSEAKHIPEDAALEIFKHSFEDKKSTEMNDNLFNTYTDASMIIRHTEDSIDALQMCKQASDLGNTLNISIDGASMINMHAEDAIDALQICKQASEVEDTLNIFTDASKGKHHVNDNSDGFKTSMVKEEVINISTNTSRIKDDVNALKIINGTEVKEAEEHTNLFNTCNDASRDKHNVEDNFDGLHIYHHASQVEEYVEDHANLFGILTEASEVKQIRKEDNNVFKTSKNVEATKGKLASEVQQNLEEGVDVLQFLNNAPNIQEGRGNILNIFTNASKVTQNLEQGVDVLSILNHASNVDESKGNLLIIFTDASKAKEACADALRISNQASNVEENHGDLFKIFTENSKGKQNLDVLNIINYASNDKDGTDAKQHVLDDIDDVFINAAKAKNVLDDSVDLMTFNQASKFEEIADRNTFSNHSKVEENLEESFNPSKLEHEKIEIKGIEECLNSNITQGGEEDMMRMQQEKYFAGESVQQKETIEDIIRKCYISDITQFTPDINLIMKNTQRPKMEKGEPQEDATEEQISNVMQYSSEGDEVTKMKKKCVNKNSSKPKKDEEETDLVAQIAQDKGHFVVKNKSTQKKEDAKYSPFLIDVAKSEKEQGDVAEEKIKKLFINNVTQLAHIQNKAAKHLNLLSDVTKSENDEVGETIRKPFINDAVQVTSDAALNDEKCKKKDTVEHSYLFVDVTKDENDANDDQNIKRHHHIDVSKPARAEEHQEITWVRSVSGVVQSALGNGQANGDNNVLQKHQDVVSSETQSAAASNDNVVRNTEIKHSTVTKHDVPTLGRHEELQDNISDVTKSGNEKHSVKDSDFKEVKDVTRVNLGENATRKRVEECFSGNIEDVTSKINNIIEDTPLKHLKVSNEGSELVEFEAHENEIEDVIKKRFISEDWKLNPENFEGDMKNQSENIVQEVAPENKEQKMEEERKKHFSISKDDADKMKNLWKTDYKNYKNDHSSQLSKKQDDTENKNHVSKTDQKYCKKYDTTEDTKKTKISHDNTSKDLPKIHEKINPYQETVKKQNLPSKQSHRREFYGRIYQEIIRNPKFNQHQDLINSFIMNDVFKPHTETNEDFTIEEERIRKLINRSSNYKPLMGTSALLAKTRFDRNDSEIVQELVTERFANFLNNYYQRSFHRQNSRLQKSGLDQSGDGSNQTYESLGNFQNIDEDLDFTMRSPTPTRLDRSYQRESGEFIRFSLPTEGVVESACLKSESSGDCINPACRSSNRCFSFKINPANKCCCVENSSRCLRKPDDPSSLHHQNTCLFKDHRSYGGATANFSGNELENTLRLQEKIHSGESSQDYRRSQDTTTEFEGLKQKETFAHSMRGVVDYSHVRENLKNPTNISSYREQPSHVQDVLGRLRGSKHLEEDVERNKDSLSYERRGSCKDPLNIQQPRKYLKQQVSNDPTSLQPCRKCSSSSFECDPTNSERGKISFEDSLENVEHLWNADEDLTKNCVSSERLEQPTKHSRNVESNFDHTTRKNNSEASTEINFHRHSKSVEFPPKIKAFSPPSNPEKFSSSTRPETNTNISFEPSFQSTLARSSLRSSKNSLISSQKRLSDNSSNPSLKTSEPSAANRFFKKHVTKRVANFVSRSSKTALNSSTKSLYDNTSESELRMFDQEERILDHEGSSRTRSGSTVTIKDSLDFDFKINDMNLDFLLSTDEHNVETSAEFLVKEKTEDFCDDDSDKVSYDAHKFLRDALGDELKAYLSTDSQLISDLDCTGNHSIGTSNISDLLSKASSYGAIQNASDRAAKRNSTIYEENCYSQNEYADYLSNSKKLADLILEANVQNQILTQTHKALTLCRRTKEFVASIEEIEAERILLVATLKREALKEEIQRIEYEDLTDSPYQNSGCVRIKGLTFPPKPRNSFVPNLFDKRRKDFTHWFVGVLKSGATVLATKPAIPDTDGMVKFDEEFIFDHLSPDFTVIVAIYIIKIKNNMRNYSHESKFHLNKNVNTLCPSPHKLFHITRDTKTKTPEETAVSSSFVLGGKCVIGINNLKDLGYFKLTEMPLCSMLEGTVVINFLTSVTMNEEFSDFLNVGAETGEFIAWNRRWCSIQGPYLLYFNYPEDEEPVSRLDLSYCITSYITCAERKICARPRTLLLETAVKGSSEYSPKVVKHFLAADTLHAMKVWESKLNHTVSALRNWNCMKCNFVFNKT